MFCIFASEITNPQAFLMIDQFLKGKVAIVTGANSGIGKSIAQQLAHRGAKVVINYRSHPEQTEAVLSEISAAGGIAIGGQADITNLNALQEVVDLAVSTFGRLDIMVNNAGLETRTSILDTTPADYDKVLDVNLKSTFFGTQFAAKQMIIQGGGGRVINISSVHEDWPMPNNTAYCLAKGGVRMLARTAGVELAPHGITVVNVGPGAVNTPINASTINNPLLLAKLNSAIPMGRMAEPEEIASLVAFLASDAASYITATSIFADGGIMHSSPGL
jgi:glucose 1-dehydrogenase